VSDPGNMLLLHNCLHHKFGGSVLNGWCVIMEIFQISLALYFLHFKVTQGHCNITRIDRPYVTRYWCSIVTMGLCRTVSVYLTPPLSRFPLEFSNGGGWSYKKSMMLVPDDVGQINRRTVRFAVTAFRCACIAC